MNVFIVKQIFAIVPVPWNMLMMLDDVSSNMLMMFEHHQHDDDDVETIQMHAKILYFGVHLLSYYYSVEYHSSQNEIIIDWNYLNLGVK